MSAQVANGVVPKSLSNLFQAPKSLERCQRCKEKVYQVEKVGPVNEVVFHKQCFRCIYHECGQNLTLRTYYTNVDDPNDNEVYCSKHAPKSSPYKGLDSSALGIKSALQAPAPKQFYNEQIRSTGHKPVVGSDAMFVQHPVSQSKYRKNKHMTYSKHHFPVFLGGNLQQKLQRAQEELERKQREEEDRLMERFREDREREKFELQHELDHEWEGRIKELTEKFDKDMAKKNKKDKKVMTVKYEEEMNDLKKNMTVKLQKKKEAMTLHMQKEEQAKTADMVKEHSKQMLELLAQERAKLRDELTREMQDGDSGGESADSAVALEEAIASLTLPTELPPPHPAAIRKRDLYLDPSVFEELDNDVINVAQREQSTFTDLVSQLTEHCLTDLQKARAIFRWITVKDLNVIDFATEVDNDTPMGLLRGIKFGTETYHTLFIRLCSYAGMACVEVKGHSKSVGYEPGMKIREESFQNTWNAVLIDGDWWPVQCNWGARHLVLNKDVQDKQVKSKKQDKIRYQYDEHYFLTDADEFIQEFWAQDPDWQLLEKPVTLEQFEAMPFVRSVFFHYGLEFDQTMKSVLYTDNKGGAEVKIRVPYEYAQDIVFHYQIRFADRDRRNDTEFRGAKLERFVFHSLVDGIALFSVHVPTPASYFLEIFANKIDESNRIGDDPNATMMPFRLKCACKFKIVCEELVGKMHPLPNCASGEWGPSKGRRHFGLTPITHSTGVVNVDNDAEVRFRLPRALHFLCKLRMNGVEDHVLERYIAHSVHDNMLTVRVRPPQPGQYGLDIYARPEEAADNHTLAHACKYLLNCTKVDDSIDLPVAKTEKSGSMSKERWGPSEQFKDLGLKTVSHSEPRIEKNEPGPLTIELGMHETLKLSYHLVREPDEDCRDRVTMKENGKKIKFTMNFDKKGHYMFSVYARRKKDPENNMANVYNYHIKYYPSEDNNGQESNTMKKKKKGLFGSKK